MAASANPLVRNLERLKRQWGKYDLAAYGDPADLGRRSVADLVQIVSADDPSFVARRPVHLRELTAFLDEACEGRRRSQLRHWFSYPIRHFKTVTLRHGVLKHLCRHPEQRVLWCSYNQETATEQSQAKQPAASRQRKHRESRPAGA